MYKQHAAHAIYIYIIYIYTLYIYIYYTRCFKRQLHQFSCDGHTFAAFVRNCCVVYQLSVKNYHSESLCIYNIIYFSFFLSFFLFFFFSGLLHSGASLHFLLSAFSSSCLHFSSSQVASFSSSPPPTLGTGFCRRLRLRI